MKKSRYILLLFSVISFSSLTFAQSKKDKDKMKEAEVRQMVNDHNYTFQAQYANPIGGGHRYITPDYDVRVTKDSVIAYLPYFGRAYFDVPYNPTDGGIKFTSTKFTYVSKEKKKGGWDITIEPKDVKYLQRMTFFISQSGYANLGFIMTNRSAISFDGVLKDKKN